MNPWLAVAALALATWVALASLPGGADQQAPDRPGGGTVATGRDAAIEHAYANRLRHAQVEGRGVVVKLLADDRAGSRHQRFVLQLASGRTLLVAHNIDLAARIDNLRVGDAVAFNGEYEWNRKGGLIHWTHHDPQGRHAGGWLRHDGRVYQ